MSSKYKEWPCTEKGDRMDSLTWINTRSWCWPRIQLIGQMEDARWCETIPRNEVLISRNVSTFLKCPASISARSRPNLPSSKLRAEPWRREAKNEGKRQMVRTHLLLVLENGTSDGSDWTSRTLLQIFRAKQNSFRNLAECSQDPAATFSEPLLADRKIPGIFPE